MLGSGNYSFKTKTGVLLYGFATIFMPIGMLNMVISVVSDTYERVQMNKKVQDLKMKAGMLQDYHQFLLMFKKRNTELGHIYVFRKVRD